MNRMSIAIIISVSFVIAIAAGLAGYATFVAAQPGDESIPITLPVVDGEREPFRSPCGCVRFPASE